MSTKKTDKVKLNVKPMRFPTKRSGNKLTVTCRDAQVAILLQKGMRDYGEFVAALMICACLNELPAKLRPKVLETAGEIVFAKK